MTKWDWLLVAVFSAAYLAWSWRVAQLYMLLEH
jgi:hypothetical protein